MSSNKKIQWRLRLYQVIYQANTPAGKLFDVALILFILLSIVLAMLDTVAIYHQRYGSYFSRAEWFFTLIFSVEYLLRLISIQRPLKYVFSFYGIVDFLAIAPTYLSFFFPGMESFLFVRILRILRIFRVLKLARYTRQANTLWSALAAGKIKIIVFLSFISTITVIFGSTMYLIEGPENGFTSIPRGIYWAIITLTTVGYGDIAPKTDLGQAVASVVMILGYAIIAVPTGIFTAELSKAINKEYDIRTCSSCNKPGHDSDAKYCKACGHKLQV